MRDFLQFIYSLFYVTLLILGIAGISYRIFMEGGILETMVGRFVDFEVRNPVMLLPTALGALLVGYLWHAKRISPSGKPGLLGALLNALLLATGAYYAVVLARQYAF